MVSVYAFCDESRDSKNAHGFQPSKSSGKLLSNALSPPGGITQKLWTVILGQTHFQQNCRSCVRQRFSTRQMILPELTCSYTQQTNLGTKKKFIVAQPNRKRIWQSHDRRKHDCSEHLEWLQWYYNTYESPMKNFAQSTNGAGNPRKWQGDKREDYRSFFINKMQKYLWVKCRQSTPTHCVKNVLKNIIAQARKPKFGLQNLTKYSSMRGICLHASQKV